MAGKKIEQARKALKSVLNNLRDEDLFNVVVYDDRVESLQGRSCRAAIYPFEWAWRNFARGADLSTISARGKHKHFDAAALKTALAMIQDSTRPSYVLFLTDGLPTAGETRELAIADNCRRANTRRTRVFSFGVGYDVNARLLDRLSGGNSGTSEYVKPDEDLETHVARFYSKMTSPVLSEIQLELAGVDINRTYPRDIPDLFEGGQIVCAGRYRQSGKTTIRVRGKIGSERRELEFPAELAGANTGTSRDFVERLWVVRRLGDLIDQIDLHGQNKELVDELVALSTKYGILTPYTTFLADERVQLHAMIDNANQAHRALDALNTVDGQAGVYQRSVKQEYLTAARAPANMAQAPALAQNESLGEMKARGAAGGRLAAPDSNQTASPSQSASMGRQHGMMGGRDRWPRPRPAAVGRHSTFASGPAQAPDQSPQSLDGKVRQIGAKTFYWKNKRWVDSTVQPDEDAKATLVTQFTDEYFQLARTQKSEYNQYFSQSEPLTVKLDDTVYRVEPAK